MYIHIINVNRLIGRKGPAFVICQILCIGWHHKHRTSIERRSTYGFRLDVHHVPASYVGVGFGLGVDIGSLS